LGRHAIQAATKNLEDLGWLTTERIIQPDGRFGGKAWIINDFTSVTNSTVEPTAVENLTHIKKTKANKTISKENTFNEVEQASRYSEDFETFWAAYPKRQQKGEAYKAWEQLRKKKLLPSLDVLTVAAQNYAARVSEPKFTKLPAGWLRAEMWLDEPVAPKRPVDPDAWMNNQSRIRPERMELDS
jgi:hypothetical protein